MINVKMQPTESHGLSPKITVIGVGGAGGNAVNNMISSGLEGCEFLTCNTDAQALNSSLSAGKIQLGTNVTGGLGAGSKPDVGKAAAEESLEEVLSHVDGANMVFVTAGMGGGTGTGAAPVIAKACRERGILTVGVVTKPFHFEGSHRMKMAEDGLAEMKEYVDTLIVIPNQNLFRVANENTTFAQAFEMADGVLQAGVKGVTDLIVRPGLVNLDFADIRTAMLEMGKAMMGTGEAEGDKRAVEAAEAAINNPLLDDVSMKGARGVIINVTGGMDMTLFEADEACNKIREEVDPSANIIFGATFDDKLEGKMRVSIVATGIDRNASMGNGSGGGSLTIESQGGSNTVIERAEPQAQSSSDTSSPATAVSGAEALKGISAPTAPSSVQSEAMMVQPENDMFEQSEFAASSSQETSEIASNTAMRGTIYKDSFIPPRPAQIEAAPVGVQEFQVPIGVSAAGTMPQSVMASQPVAQPSTAGLKLNPPRPPSSSDQPKSPSLFERITGTVQQGLEGMKQATSGYDHGQPVSHNRAAPSIGGGAGGAHHSPAQGALNIDAPSKPAVKTENDLDIPAFLRRQAN
jgi:cell division protein FtsZ